MFACAKQLAAANRLQKYKIFPTYTNLLKEKFHFCLFLTKNKPLHHTFFRYVPLCGCKGITFFRNRRSSFYFLLFEAKK